MIITAATILIANLMVIIGADESQFSINANKAVQILNDRYLSITLDPAIFFTDLTTASNRAVTLGLMKHLTPAYLRISGPATQFINFSADDRKSTRVIGGGGADNDEDRLVFSPAMWWSLNEFIQMSNFTPIFAIGDRATDKGGKWNTEDLSALLDMTAKMNVICLWQVGHDCSDKGFDRYKEHLGHLRRLINSIPDKKDKWQVVGSDLSKCSPSDYAEILRMYLADFKDADAIVWSSPIPNRMDPMKKLLNHHQANIPVWLSVAKSERSVDFDAALSWAAQIGQAARDGFQVVFREPRIQEFFAATPVYWTTVLHKKLMGRNVLDVITLPTTMDDDAYIYAQCTRDQNSYAIRGAMTLMIVNNASGREHKTSFRLPAQAKSIEVRSYVLTGAENARDTFLNGELLSLENFEPRPQLRRAKILTHLTLTVPPKSIGFFVLPAAKIPVCIRDEDDTALILQEIDRIQSVDFPQDKSSLGAERLLNRFGSGNNKRTRLSELYRNIESEMKQDDIAMPRSKLKSKSNQFAARLQQMSRNQFPKKAASGIMRTANNDETNEQLADASGNDKERDRAISVLKSMTSIKGRKGSELQMNPSKTDLFTNPRLELKANSLSIRNMFRGGGENEEVVAVPKLDLELTSGEVRKILNDRARAEKRVGLGGLESALQKLASTRASRARRAPDINMPLLEMEMLRQDNKRKHAMGKDKEKIKQNNNDLSMKSTTEKNLYKDFEESKGLKNMENVFAQFGTPLFPKMEPHSFLNPPLNLDDFPFNQYSINNEDLTERNSNNFEKYLSDMNNWETPNVFSDLFQIKKRSIPSGKTNEMKNSQRQHFHDKDKPPMSKESFEETIKSNNFAPGDTSALTKSAEEIMMEDLSNDQPIGDKAKINGRNARHVAGEINSAENAIDDFLDSKRKTKKFIKPSMLLANKDLTLVFSTPHILSGKNGGNNELAAHFDHEAKKTTEITSENVDDSTCLATDLFNTGTTTGDDDKGASLLETNVGDDKTERRQLRSQHIQKIPKVVDDVSNSTKYEVVVKTIMNTVKRFVKKVKDVLIR